MAEKKKVHETVIREVIEKPSKKKTSKKKSSSKKKSTKKKSSSKKKKTPSKTIIPKKIEVRLENNVEKILVENFVSLQKVMTNLSLKFDNLTGQISKLLELFELSAKSLAEKDFELEKSNKDNKKVLEKIEGILNQNKTLARGLTLMNEKIEESIMSQDIVEPLPPIIAQVPTAPQKRPLPPPRAIPPSQAFQEAMSVQLNPPQIKKPLVKKHSKEDEYKKSISSKTQEQK